MNTTTTGNTARPHGNEHPTPAAEPATGFDADNLTAADELAIDIGRVAIEAREGVTYGSEPDEFFLEAGKAVLFWLQLNGHLPFTAEQVEDVQRILSVIPTHRTDANANLVQAIASAHRLRARFPATEPAEEETKAEAATRCPICFGLNGSHNTIHERYPAGGGGTNKPCPNSLPAVTEEVKAHCRCVTPDWYHEGMDSDIDGRLCRRCRLRQNIPYRDLVNSPVARTAVSAFSVAALALRNALEVLDPHEGGDWEHAWQTIADLEDCAGRFDAFARTEKLS